MELHAWIVTIPIGNTRQVKLLGKKSVTRKQPSICKLYKGTWYLDPGNPQTDNYLASIVREIVSRYDIDGIHLDYIRYPERASDFPDQSIVNMAKKNLYSNGAEIISPALCGVFIQKQNR